jgi:hypothetical protein
MPKYKPLTDETGEVRELLMEDLRRFRPALDVLSASSLRKLGKISKLSITTDQKFVELLNSAGIKGVIAKYHPTMAYDSAEHVSEILVTAMGSVALKLLAEWIIMYWNKEKPSKMIINNHTVSNAEQIATIINNSAGDLDEGIS